MTYAEAKRYERDPSAAQRDARKVIERHDRDAKARQARARALPAHPAARAADKRKAEKKQQRRERIAAIRLAVFARWGECALCASVPTDLHHVISGPERRRHESTETTIPVCALHHRELHRGDLDALEGALYACETACMPLAVKALGRRIDKLLEARAPADPSAAAARKDVDHE